MAQNLAGDLDFVQMAKELLSSLQCAGAEHLVSLPIWHNQRLLNAFQQCRPLLTMKENSPLDDQHVEEGMARIMDHPSLKRLLGEKEDLCMIRGALIILFAYWIDFDNEDETMEDVLSSEDESEEDETCLGSAEEMSDSETESLITAETRKLSLEESVTPDSSLIARLVNDPGLISLACSVARDMGFVQMAEEIFSSSLECDGAEQLLSLSSLPIMQNKQFLNALVEKMKGFIDLNESIIFDLVEHPCIEKIACEVESGSGLAIILDELLKSVVQPCVSTSLHEDCMKHFKIINMAWEDNQLISLLLKQECSFYKIGSYSQDSCQQLCEKLTPLIKANTPEDILFENEASSVRGALTILIGYFSSKNMISMFDDVMGRGGAVGIKTVRYSNGSDATKVERTSTCERRAFMEPSSTRTLDELMPDASLLCQLYHDASFKDLSQKIQSDPSAAEFADFILNCFQNPEEGGRYNLKRVFHFWLHSSSTHLRRALKKCPSLFELFKKLSDGAEMLRLKERLDRIRGDGFLRTIDHDKSDFSLKMRLALSILIGYWSANDVTGLVRPLLFCKLDHPSNATQLEDLRDVECICYWADSNLDLEGLKKVLASKYTKGSPEFENRVAQIEHHLKPKVSQAVDSGYDNTDAKVSAILKGGRCIWIYFLWFTKVGGRLHSAT